MSYALTWKRRREKKYQIIYKRGPSTLALVFAGMAIGLWGIFVFLSSFPIFLYLFYTVSPGITAKLSKSLDETRSQSVVAAQEKTPTQVPNEVVPTITKDLTLPVGQYLTIPTLGIDTTIWEASPSAYEEALRKGVWRVPDFATPETPKEGRPIILAAHRFGYVAWTQDYREKHSFYNLPDIKVGESIVLTWNQHRYTYRVKAIEEGKEITDYSSDLILYTCKFLVSPIRVFVYAELVQ